LVKNSEKVVYLLPKGKVEKVEALINEGGHIAFVVETILNDMFSSRDDRIS